MHVNFTLWAPPFREFKQFMRLRGGVGARSPVVATVAM
jgi:hypothetical protein